MYFKLRAMNSYFPVGLAIVGIAIYYFYETSRVNRIRKEERLENRRDRQKEIIQSLLKKKDDPKHMDDSNELPEKLDH